MAATETADSPMAEQEFQAPTKFNLDDMTNKVMAYCQTQADTDLYPYQVEFGKAIIKSVLANTEDNSEGGDEVTALFSRQSGKTETLVVVIPGLMTILPALATIFPNQLGIYRNGLWVGLFAPSKEQCITMFSRAGEKIRSKHSKLIMADPEIGVDFESEKGNPLQLTNGSRLQYHSAALQSHIESKTYHLILMEESQDIDRMKARKSIRPMGAATAATIVQIGTCNQQRSDFYDQIRNNMRFQAEGGKRRLHFQYDYKTAAKYNPRYAAYVKKEMERLGYDSDEFRMAYRLHWIFERGMFITQEALEDTYDKSMMHVVSDTEAFCIAGLDIGKSEDSTVCTVARVDWDDLDQFERPLVEILNWKEITGDSHEAQFHQLVDFMNHFNIRILHIDSTGKGDPVADRFEAHYEGQMQVIPYTFSRQSKSAMWKNLDSYFQGGRIIIPGHAKTRRLRAFQRFEGQLLDLEKSYQGQYMVCNHPDVKGAKDDYADSIGLCMMGVASELRMPEIEVEDNVFFRTRMDYSMGYGR